MGEVQVGDVNGVPAFWVNSGRPTLTASLIFRQGLVDETLATTGWTHLLEHLALHGRGAGPLHVNGAVSLLHTRFDAHGPADRVATTLTEVSRWLTDPDFTEMSREQSVLRAEAAMRGGGEGPLALLQRYGAKGPGLCAYAEPGLSRATTDELRDLAGRVFTTGNAVLFLDGPPPPALTLRLGDGALNPSPAAVPCMDTLPAAYLIRAGITLSGVVPRSMGATFLPHMLREVLTEQFREKAGGAYAPWSQYEPVDDDHALVVAGSDANTELLRTIAATGRDEVARLASGQIADDLVANIRDQLLQQVQDPYALPTLAYRAATDHLRGQPPLTLQETLTEIAEVTAADVVAEAGRFQDTLLVGIAGKATWKKEIPMLAMPLDPQRLHAPGRRSRDFPADRRTLRVNAEGVQLCGAREYRTVRVQDLAGMFAYPDGAREVIDADGWTIKVEPTLWAKGPAITRQLDEIVPASLHIPMLARDADRIPQPLKVHARMREATAQLRRNPRAMLAILATVWVLLFGGYTLGTGHPPVGGLVATLAVGAVAARKARIELGRQKTRT